MNDAGAVRGRGDHQPPGERFDYDAEAQAIICREGDSLRWAEFPDIGWRDLANRPPGTVGGDWLVWCVYDEFLDKALVVRAELRSHYEERRARG